MSYQELLRTHSYRYQRRLADIPTHQQKLGLVEQHASIPLRQFFMAGFNETPASKPLTTDEQLRRDGVGLTPSPAAFPNTGYLGKGLSSP